MKHPMKWAGVALALCVAACGVKYLPALWSKQFAVMEANALVSPTVARELADGSVRVAYQRAPNTIVVDTYDNAGNISQQHAFTYPSSEWTQGGAKPLFAADDVLYWFGRDEQHSLKIDLVTNTAQPLSAVLALDLGDAEAFEFGDAILLENGQLVLAGGDRFASSFHPGNGRIVVINTDGSVQTVVLDNHNDFSNLAARAGTDQYFAQSFSFQLGFPLAVPTTYLGDSNLLVEQPQMSEGMILQADQNGAWAIQIGGAGLLRYDAGLALSRRDDNLFAWKIQLMSDQHYLLLEASEDRLGYAKRDSEGNLLWAIPASANATFESGMIERNGTVLLSETTRTRTSGTLVKDNDPVEIIPIAKVSAKVRHRLLDADGKELARFSEPDYKATLERNPILNIDGSAVEFSAGSCEHAQAHLLSNGNFVALSRWCSDNSVNDRQQALHYFEQP